MVTAQKLKEAEITEQDSLLLTRNLLRIAIFNISYIRGLFPEKYFNDKNVPALEMKIKKLMPMDAESRRLIDWMEKGVYDALQKKYLKTLLFCVCEAVDGPMIEEYAFSFSYSASDSQDVSINVNRTGNKKGGTIECNSDTVVTPNQMRSSACKMIRTLVQLMRTLDKMPTERTILMKLLYYDDVTPADYEPPFFRGCKEEETQNSWAKNPLKMEVGDVNSKHLVIALKVKSVLDPCEDENEDIVEDGISFGADSAQSDEPSDSDCDATAQEQNNDYVIAPIAKNILEEEEVTEDPNEDEEQFVRVKNWIDKRHLDSVELTDILANFPDISIALTEEIMERLVREGILYKTGSDCYCKDKLKVFEYDSAIVKVEDGAALQDDATYATALCHVLQMKYVTVAKLQSKLGKGNNAACVRTLIDKMAQDGYVDPKAHRRFGNRVIQSAAAQKKLADLKRAIESEKKGEGVQQKAGDNSKDNSTCGILRSIGSDLTRMRIASEMNQQGSLRTQQTVASRESVAQGVANGKTNESEAAVCSKSSQEKKSRKASMVKDPILQNVKRLKSQAG